MNTQTDPTQNGMEAARQSFSGKGLTESQFQEAWAITGILHAEIQKSGSFREKLTDYAHAFARNQKFDAMRGETILRNIYTAGNGRSMNQTREALMEREAQVPETAQPEILAHAERVERLIQDGPTQPFYKAYDQAAVELAGKLQITQSGAKEMMKEAYRTAHGRDLYEAGKELEEAYHKPVREAEIASRKAEKLESPSQQRAQSQSMG